MPYAVVMATRNGELFLHQQLLTLERQTIRPAEVVIVDDASSDRTNQILRDWALQQPFRVVLHRHTQRAGATASFARGLSISTTPAALLADQDDLWDADKAERALRCLAELEQDYGRSTPCLVHTDLRLIDAEGADLGASFAQWQQLNLDRCAWQQLAWQNVVTGCTVALNRACIQAALPFPEAVVQHDGWLALVAAALGVIHTDPHSAIAYRQHGANLVGAQGFRQLTRQRLFAFGHLDGRARERLRLAAQVRQLQALLDRHGAAIGARAGGGLRRKLQQLGNANPWCRLEAALTLPIQKHGWRRQLATLVLLLSGPLPLDPR